MEKITKRIRFEQIKELVKDVPELVEFCDNEIALLDKKALKAKETAAKKKAEGDPLRDKVFEVMSDAEFEPIAVITERVGDNEATVAKVSYRLNALVKDGLVEKSEVTIPATETSKARKVCAYKRIAE